MGEETRRTEDTRGDTKRRRREERREGEQEETRQERKMTQGDEGRGDETREAEEMRQGNEVVITYCPELESFMLTQKHLQSSVQYCQQGGQSCFQGSH